MKRDEAVPPGAASTKGFSPAGDRASRRAHAALRQHAALFEALGMKTAHESDSSILLEDRDLSFLLEYRLRRRILSRIYGLQANVEVPTPTPGRASPYRLVLKTGGLVSASYGLAATGPGADEGRTVADRVVASGVLDELARNVDLERLSIAWSPEDRAWQVSVEPYPGDYIHVLLPPIRYTVRLKEPEAAAIRRFLIDVSRVLKQSKP